jgi:hypothetical protein
LALNTNQSINENTMHKYLSYLGIKMKHLTNSLIAAFVATIVLSLLMIMKKIIAICKHSGPEIHFVI